MILDEIYLFLKSAGLVRTHAAFSTDYLGHSDRYYDYLRCSGAQPSLCSLLKLGMSLHDMARETDNRAEQAVVNGLARQAMAQALARCR